MSLDMEVTELLKKITLKDVYFSVVLEWIDLSKRYNKQLLEKRRNYDRTKELENTDSVDDPIMCRTQVDI